MTAAPQQVNLDEMTCTGPEFVLLAPVGTPSGSGGLVGGTGHLNDGDHLHITIAVHDMDGPFVDLQGLHFEHQGGAGRRLCDGGPPGAVAELFHTDVGDALTPHPLDVNPLFDGGDVARRQQRLELGG